MSKFYPQAVEINLGDNYGGEITTLDNAISDDSDFAANHTIDLGKVCKHVIIHAETPSDNSDIIYFIASDTPLTRSEANAILTDATAGTDKRRKLKGSQNITTFSMSFIDVRYLYFLKRNSGTAKIYVDANAQGLPE